VGFAVPAAAGVSADVAAEPDTNRGSTAGLRVDSACTADIAVTVGAIPGIPGLNTSAWPDPGGGTLNQPLLLPVPVLLSPASLSSELELEPELDPVLGSAGSAGCAGLNMALEGGARLAAVVPNVETDVDVDAVARDLASGLVVVPVEGVKEVIAFVASAEVGAEPSEPVPGPAPGFDGPPADRAGALGGSGMLCISWYSNVRASMAWKLFACYECL
jgi:hypothetical protein